MAHLHPALVFPSQELDLVRRKMRAARDSRRTVVLLDALVATSPRSMKSRVMGVPGYGVGCWM